MFGIVGHLQWAWSHHPLAKENIKSLVVQAFVCWYKQLYRCIGQCGGASFSQMTAKGDKAQVREAEMN